jgi:hemolysin-activating ACP:hemolysin acyltransferase
MMNTNISTDRPALRTLQPANPATALGLAVSHLMTKPAFAALGFGHWSRVLVGQINRKHYHLVLDTQNRVAGFVGWVMTNEAAADAWLRGHRPIEGPDMDDGDCIIINAWSADTPAVNRLALAAMRDAGRDRRLIYFKRFYPDGRVRPMRLPMTAFAARSIA